MLQFKQAAVGVVPVLFLLAVVLNTPSCVRGSPARRLYTQGFAEADTHAKACATQDCGEAVSITRLLEQNRRLGRDHEKTTKAIADATRVAGLGPGLDGSFAGFIEVNKTTENSLFYWYFPSQDGNKKAPLLIWLQGGPGGASTFGLFAEIGPSYLTADLKLHPRPYTWNKNYSLLFIDNPVGAGYSFTGTGKGYAQNSKTDVARDLYSAMVQFYKAYPGEAKNDLYITGESFAGHYIPAFGAYIHEQNAKAKRAATGEEAQQGGQGSQGSASSSFAAVSSSSPLLLPLKGVSIGDGWTDPGLQMTATPSLMFNLGLSDAAQTAVLQEYTDNTTRALAAGDYHQAFVIWDMMLNGDIWPHPTYFYNITGTLDYDNFLRQTSPAEFGYYGKYITQAAVRKAIHVGNATLNDGHECEMNLVDDVFVSYKTELATLMDNYKVLVYNGQLDLIVGVPLTETYLPTVKWSGRDKYISAPRAVWKDGTDVAGYARAAGQFRQVVVRGAGHIVPYDQGKRSLDMLSRFISGTPFDKPTAADI